MNSKLYVWVDKEQNLIANVPGVLPKNWRNYNDFNMIDNESVLNGLGWYNINDESLLECNYSAEWLNQFKMQLLENVSYQRWEAQTEPVTYDGNVYLLNEGTINALYQKRMVVESDPSATFYWKTRDGMIQLTSGELVSLTTSINNYIQECFNIENNFINSLSSMNTLEELLQVDLDITWPSTTLT